LAGAGRAVEGVGKIGGQVSKSFDAHRQAQEAGPIPAVRCASSLIAAWVMVAG